MEQIHYRIGEASASLGLHDKNSNTLRSWVEEFKDFLGASANPEAGKPRFFTEDDVRVLRTVRDLRAIHLPYNEIRARLAQGTHSVESPEAATGQAETMERLRDQETSLLAAEQMQALITPMTRAAEEWRALAEQYRGRLEERETRVAALEQRLDGLQSKLEDLYSSAIARTQAQPSPPPMPTRPLPTKRRRWLLGF